MEERRHLRVVLAALVASVALPVAASAGLVDIADLPAGVQRVHPDSSLNLEPTAPVFSVFTGGSLPSANWGTSPIAQEANSFAGGVGLAGTLYSEVWRHTDNHLLFRYRIANTGTLGIKMGNIAGWNPNTIGTIDSGILDPNGDLAFDQGDILALQRDTGAAPQLGFSFETTDQNGDDVSRPLAGGQTSQWFYVETSAQQYGFNMATVQGSGATADHISALVPVPDPATIALMSVGGVIALGRRRRGRRTA